MSLDKAIASGAEHRREYHGAGRFDPTCRPHGACFWCYRARRGLDEEREAIELEEASEEAKGGVQ